MQGARFALLPLASGLPHAGAYLGALRCLLRRMTVRVWRDGIDGVLLPMAIYTLHVPLRPARALDRA